MTTTLDDKALREMFRKEAERQVGSDRYYMAEWTSRAVDAFGRAVRDAALRNAADIAENCTINPASPVGQEMGAASVGTHNRACATSARAIRALIPPGET